VRTYWDTSAAINAAISPEVIAAWQPETTLPACISWRNSSPTMTGRGVEITDEAGNTDRLVFAQNECAAWLRTFAEKLNFEELTKQEALKGLDKAQSLGVQGARVYDYWHALVSQKSEVRRASYTQHAGFQWLGAECGVAMTALSSLSALIHASVDNHEYGILERRGEPGPRLDNFL